MEMKIYNGNYEIIGSGTIVTQPDDPIEFNFSSLTYIFCFKNDNEDVTARMKKKQFNEGKGLQVDIINFNNNLGLGPVEPISIGTIKNRKLFLNCRIYSMSEGSMKTFHYTFLLEKEVNDGK